MYYLSLQNIIFYPWDANISPLSFNSFQWFPWTYYYSRSKLNLTHLDCSDAFLPKSMKCDIETGVGWYAEYFSTFASKTKSSGDAFPARTVDETPFRIVGPQLIRRFKRFASLLCRSSSFIKRRLFCISASVFFWRTHRRNLSLSSMFKLHSDSVRKKKQIFNCYLFEFEMCLNESSSQTRLRKRVRLKLLLFILAFLFKFRDAHELKILGAV